MAGWDIRDIPGDTLINFWEQMQQRRMQDINARSYSAAIGAAAPQTEPGKKIQIAKYLPFDLSAADGQPNKISPETIAILERERDNLPPRMVADLYRHKIINPQ